MLVNGITMVVKYKYTMLFKVKLTSVWNRLLLVYDDFHDVMILQVLLFCLITYGHSRPSDADERDEIIRESKKEKYFQQ